MAERLKIARCGIQATRTVGAATIMGSLKACTIHKDLHRGIRIYADIIRRGLLENNTYVGNALVNMLARCGALGKAHEVFDNLPDPNVASWNVLIAGYVHHGRGKEALNLFEHMKSKGLSPNAITFICSLKACASVGSPNKGEEVHDKMVRDGFLETEVVVGTALIDMYGKCGLLERAQEIFDKVQVRNVVSWNALISGYAQHGHGIEALNCFEQMHGEGLFPDAVTYTCSLKACGSIGATFRGQQIHVKIGNDGILEKDIVLANALVDMYAKTGCLAKAQNVFEKIQTQDIVSWNVLIAGYTQHGFCKQALCCFEQMKCEGLSADTITIACILKACGSMGDAETGEEIHAQFCREGLLGNEIVVGNALVDMYGKCGMLEKALQVFYELPFRDVVSWNGVIASYIQNGYSEKALQCVEWMRMESLSPSPMTFLYILKACSTLRDSENCHRMHSHIIIKGLLEKDRLLGTALLETYGSCSMLAEARNVFGKFLDQDVVSWNALMTGYAQHGHIEETWNCFESLQNEGLSPNVPTFVCILKVCGSIGAAYKGQEVHAEITRGGSLRKDLVIGTALVDMYSGCGMLARAQDIFDVVPTRDVLLWNSIIIGYSRMGEHETVFTCFDRMREEGEEPNMATLSTLLNTCCHTGLLDKGQMCFETMSVYYGIILNVEHHTCMIDLFCRAGQLDKAVAMAKEMPLSADISVWHTLLGACQNLGHMKLGRLAYEHAEQLNEEDAATHVFMRNVCAAYTGRQEEA